MFSRDDSEPALWLFDLTVHCNVSYFYSAAKERDQNDGEEHGVEEDEPVVEEEDEGFHTNVTGTGN